MCFFIFFFFFSSSSSSFFFFFFFFLSFLLREYFAWLFVRNLVAACLCYEVRHESGCYCALRERQLPEEWELYEASLLRIVRSPSWFWNLSHFLIWMPGSSGTNWNLTGRHFCLTWCYHPQEASHLHIQRASRWNILSHCCRFLSVRAIVRRIWLAEEHGSRHCYVIFLRIEINDESEVIPL